VRRIELGGLDGARVVPRAGNDRMAPAGTCVQPRKYYDALRPFSPRWRVPVALTHMETSMNFTLPALVRRACIALSLAAVGLSAAAQTPPPPYGQPIGIEQAKKAMTAAEAEARKNNWQVVIAVVDTGGHLVMLQRLDAQNASVDIAIGKASTAVNFRRPTKALEDSLAPGGSALRILAVRGATPLQGGLPIVVDGKIIGGIGVSGVQAAQDEVVAKAGADALAAK
jgi:glc operon protein GlcG